MRARLATLVGVVALAPALVPPVPASAAAPMCQGREATIVSPNNGTNTSGTEGDDVIVAGARAQVIALGGDDIICVASGIVSGGDGNDSLSAMGGGGEDHVAVDGTEDLDIRLRGDDDAVRIVGLTMAGRGSIDGGRGNDLLMVHADVTVAVDLEDERLFVDSLATYSLTGFRDVVASARTVRVEGDAEDNRLSVLAKTCTGSIMGGRGDDLLAITDNLDQPAHNGCSRNEAPRIYGQRGDDRLRGRARDDVLVGGPGQDVASGSRGVDRCRAERTHACEL